MVFFSYFIFPPSSSVLFQASANGSAGNSHGKVWFSLVQRPFCLNLELKHQFSLEDFPEPELNPRFRLERVQFGFGERPNPELNPEPFI